MSPTSPHFFPLAQPLVLGLLFILGLLIALIEIGLIGYAYEKMGVQRRYVFAVLLLSLLGSYVNIPVAELPVERVVSGQEVTFIGMRYVIPLVEEWPRTIIAVNVGGAVIPTLLSLYLLVKTEMYGRALVGVAIVTTIVHGLAYPSTGWGSLCRCSFHPWWPPQQPSCYRASPPLPGLYRREPGDVDRGGSPEPREHSATGRTHRLHRRGGSIRRDFHDRAPRGLASVMPGGEGIASASQENVVREYSWSFRR